MNAFAISSPLQRRISQDIHDLQAEIGREAARAYCACQLESPRFTETAPDGSVQDLSNLGPNCDLVFDDFINFPIEDCPAVEPCPSDGKSVSCEDDPTGATTSTVSGTLNGEPGCPSHGRPQKMIPVIQVDCLFRKRLQAFLNQYWHTLRTDGLFTQTPSQCIDLKDPERTRRLWDFSLLRTLRKDDDLRYLRRALALLCNLKNFEVFHQEAAHLRSCGHQPRLQHETDKQVAYNEYLAHICACETVPALRQARQALTGDLRFARRWLILTQPLTAGALLVCGESMCKKMSVENTRYPIGSLKTLVSQIQSWYPKTVELCRIMEPWSEGLIKTERIPENSHLQDIRHHIQEAQKEIDRVKAQRDGVACST